MAEFLRSFGICAKRWRLLCVLALALLIATSASAQSRPDAKKLAADELAASEQAAAAHDHRAAFEHALGAWQLDESNPGYLWAAAVQAALAGMDDKAESLFKQWQALPGRDKAQDLTAREQLADIVKRRAAAKAAQAEAASRAGDHGVARRLFLEAAALDPGDAEHLYGAAQEALAVRDEVGASRLLADYLKAAPGDAPNRPKASRQLGTFGHPAATATESAPAPRGNGWTTKQKWGVGLVGGGLALALTGGGLLWAWSEAGEELTRFQTSTVQAGQEKTLAKQLEIEDRQRNYLVSGSSAGGLGVAALAAGAWLLLNRDEATGPITVVPTSSEGRLGLLVAVRL